MYILLLICIYYLLMLGVRSFENIGKTNERTLYFLFKIRCIEDTLLYPSSSAICL